MDYTNGKEDASAVMTKVLAHLDRIVEHVSFDSTPFIRGEGHANHNSCANKARTMLPTT